MLSFNELSDVQVIAIMNVMDKLHYTNHYGIHCDSPNSLFEQWKIAINAERIARNLHQIRLTNNDLRKEKTKTQKESETEKEERKEKEYLESLRLSRMQDNKARLLAIQLFDLEQQQKFNYIDDVIAEKLAALTAKYS